jgi:hypothetical protein
MVDLVETRSDVSVKYPVCAPVDLDPDGLKGLMGRTFRAEPERHGQEVGLEDRFENDLGSRHHHPVTHRRDAERPGLTRLSRLRDTNPP